MYITVSKANLVKTLSHLYRIVEKKSNIPLLSNVKIEAGDNLKFTAINTDLEIIEIIEGNINERGDITVPVHVMHDIVRKLPEDKDIEIKTTSDASNVIIKAGNSEFTLPALPTTDFPVMTTTTMPYKFKLTTSDLIKLIDKTQFAVSTEETRYFLNGIFFETLDKDGKKNASCRCNRWTQTCKTRCSLPSRCRRYAKDYYSKKSYSRTSQST